VEVAWLGTGGKWVGAGETWVASHNQNQGVSQDTRAVDNCLPDAEKDPQLFEKAGLAGMSPVASEEGRTQVGEGRVHCSTAEGLLHIVRRNSLACYLGLLLLVVHCGHWRKILVVGEAAGEDSWGLHKVHSWLVAHCILVLVLVMVQMVGSLDVHRVVHSRLAL
jgi:hypothetical protein